MHEDQPKLRHIHKLRIKAQDLPPAAARPPPPKRKKILYCLFLKCQLTSSTISKAVGSNKARLRM